MAGRPSHGSDHQDLRRLPALPTATVP